LGGRKKHKKINQKKAELLIRQRRGTSPTRGRIEGTAHPAGPKARASIGKLPMLFPAKKTNNNTEQRQNWSWQGGVKKSEGQAGPVSERNKLKLQLNKMLEEAGGWKHEKRGSPENKRLSG